MFTSFAQHEEMIKDILDIKYGKKYLREIPLRHPDWVTFFLTESVKRKYRCLVTYVIVLTAILINIVINGLTSIVLAVNKAHIRGLN